MLPADFDVGRALLLKRTRPGTWQEIQARITEEFLPDLCTARQTLDKSEGQTLPRTLPGIGHEFWLYSRAHIYCGTLPPSMPEAVLAIAGTLEIVTAQRMIKTIQGSLRLTEDKMPQWDRTEAVQIDGRFALRIPVHDVFSRYQNGRKVVKQPAIKFHGTRQINLWGILQNGLHSSNLSHKVTGLWLNSDLSAALHWNNSSMDSFPGIALEVAANPDHLRQNRLIKGTGEGKEGRFCLELQENEVLPEAEVVAVYVAVPTSVRTAWHEQLVMVFQDMISYLSVLPIPHTFRTMDIRQRAAQLYIFTSFRLAYGSEPSAMGEEFGGPFKTIWRAFIHISIAIAKFLWIVQLESVAHRSKAFPRFHMKELPYPVRAFFSVKWPELHHWTNWTGINDECMTQWALGPADVVFQWIPDVAEDLTVLM